MHLLNESGAETLLYCSDMDEIKHVEAMIIDIHEYIDTVLGTDISIK